MSKIHLELTEDQTRWVITALEWSQDYENMPKTDPQNLFIQRIIDRVHKQLAKAKTSAPIER